MKQTVDGRWGWLWLWVWIGVVMVVGVGGYVCEITKGEVSFAQHDYDLGSKLVWTAGVTIGSLSKATILLDLAIENDGTDYDSTTIQLVTKWMVD